MTSEPAFLGSDKGNLSEARIENVDARNGGKTAGYPKTATQLVTAANRAWVNALKLAHGCADCGYAERAEGLEFDHLPGFTKVANVSAIIHKPRHVLEAEIAKCDVVCARCHRARTADRPSTRKGRPPRAKPERAIVRREPRSLAETHQKRDSYRSHARADNTKKAYASDWRHFAEWCDSHQVQQLPASDETVSLYISDLAAEGFKAATIERRIASLSIAHKTAGLESPCHSAGVRFTLAGIKRVHGAAQIGKAPTLLEDLKAMLRKIRGNNALEIRDRALLLVGFAAALRRSELVAIDWEHLEPSREGFVLTLPRSKADQMGEGARLGISRGKHAETCPVRALEAWREACGGARSGPVFRSITRWGHIEGRLSDRAVALVIQARAAAAGLDPERFGGHSLRAGFATQAIRSGVSELRAMRQTRHKSSSTFRKYVREAELFDGELRKIGL